MKPEEPINTRRNRSCQVILAILVLGLAYFISTLISIEKHGRQVFKHHGDWKALIKEHPYQRRDSDIRSPCPVLNTLANHGFISRDGKNIKKDELFDSIMLFGISPILGSAIIDYFYRASNEPYIDKSFISQFTSTDKIDLDRLRVHGILEHDVSLTRQDAALPPYDASQIMPQFVNRMIHMGDRHADKKFTRKDEGDIRRIRYLESNRNNRQFHMSLFTQLATAAECCLMLDIVGRDGAIDTTHLKGFFLDERFPDDWVPRETIMSYYDHLKNPISCWRNLWKSNVSLGLLDEIE
ncbi:Chloroperoxidase [Pilobolus umbonatus]|nr:Chloroperoxidase [Pilobolus umbonatus]